MFEWQIALKYLIPKRRSLSTALISLMSVFVISLVVWLVLVFLSVTKGLEQNWLNKLTSLYAPLRVSPTEEYYSSYFYRIDSLSSASHYTFKTLGEKAITSLSDPYSPEIDMQPPAHWPLPVQDQEGNFVDPVKKAYQELQQLGISFQDYEIGGALLRLGLHKKGEPGISYLSQMSYLLSLPSKNPLLHTLIAPPTIEELNHLLTLDSSIIEHIDNPAFQGEKTGVQLVQGSAKIFYEQTPLTPPPWAYFVGKECYLPTWPNEHGVLLPKFYQDSGAKIGDQATLSYSAASAISTQEQKIRIRVAGFYDPGILPVGSRCLIVPSEITRSIYGSTQTFSPDGTPTNGIFVWTQDPASIKQKIASRFEQAGIAPYWRIASYQEFEFSKDLMQQFQSDRTLFLLIAVIILVVACCNIISLLTLLVNDKKKEIAILHALGASSKNIAVIFGLCGMIMGCAACLLGSAAALITLHYLHVLVSLLSALQGHAAFHPAFFGSSLPNQLSHDAFLFVVIATPLLSLAAGLIPALKAARIRPSHILRSE
ncbi:MAG: FtsX-like permease family protein [Chlamydiales bacterium]|nr:FtsX-like permease family protein [Chlamydiales bacterium]